ncbi:uncharacterized protein [Panulirus ornatus]|uniref:uncharacterized protein n=1 Tax=Panulirus ornatus TaxID=150431 RepID=UPI003A86E392
MNVLVLVCVLSVAGMASAVPHGDLARRSQDVISDQEILGAIAKLLPSMRSEIGKARGRPQDILQVMVDGVMSTVRSMLSLMSSQAGDFDYHQRMSQLETAKGMIPNIMESLSGTNNNGGDSPPRHEPADKTSHFDLPGYDNAN